jgi:flagellar M-ring protein FliF
MNMTSLKRLMQRITTSWKKLQSLQRIAILSSSVLFIFLLSFFLWRPSGDEFVVLLPPGSFPEEHISDVKVLLESKNIPYKITENRSVLIPKNKEAVINMELATYNMPKSKASKGYDLFDSSTWIKGEKELQILELRALKGQLEEDLSRFDNVRSASVILDMPPPRPFGNNNYQAKASVILTLRPGARLSTQQIRAITYHIAGAVRGLAPNMIAISDTSGRLYQSINPDGDMDAMRSAEMAAEEHIKAKIDGLLSTIVGIEGFYSTVQVVMNRDKVIEERKIYTGSVNGTNLGSSVIMSVSETGQQEVKGGQNPLKLPQSSEESRSQQSKQMAVPMDHRRTTSNPGKIESISIGVLIDQNKVLNGEVGGTPSGNTAAQTNALRKDIENQLAVILKGYNVKTNYSVDFVNFEKKPLAIKEAYDPFLTLAETPQPSSSGYETALLIGLGTTAFVLLYLLLLMVFSKQPGGFFQQNSTVSSEGQEQDGMGLVEMEKLLDNMRNRVDQNPEEAAAVFRKWFTKDNPRSSSER